MLLKPYPTAVTGTVSAFSVTRFTGIKEARFRRPVVPGDTLFLEVTAVRIGSRVQRMRGEAKVDGVLCADAEIMSIIADRNTTR